MPSRRVFEMQNDFTQYGEGGICTVASLQWAKRCLELGRGLGSYAELLLSDHQLNAMMAVWRNFDNQPAAQTAAMGLRIVGGGDIVVNQIVDVQRHANLNAPHVAIFWNSHHTMGYRVGTRGGAREVEFFDNEDGLWLASNDADIRATVIARFAAAGYDQISGMRVLQV